jgi:transposase
MIDYATYCRIRQLAQEGCSSAKIAVEIGLNEKTVRKWLGKDQYRQRTGAVRTSKLQPFKSTIKHWIEQADFTTVQIYQKLQKAGYQGGRSILCDYMRLIRPRYHRAYQTLCFAPGEAAQVDWGSCGSLCIGNTRRRVSFLCVVLCHSRLLYVECFLQERAEHVLAGLANAFAYFQGVPHSLIVDNMKTAVLTHRPGCAPTFNGRFQDFCHHFGTRPVACTPRRPNEKGRVESAVGYIKGNFFNGRDLDQLPSDAPQESLNAQLRLWLEDTANVRAHRELHARPLDILPADRAAMLPLNANPCDTGQTLTVRVTNRCRVHCESNRYSVPPSCSRKQITLHRYHDRINLYDQGKLIASHLRSYDRHQQIVDPDHQLALIEEHRRSKNAAEALTFEALDPIAPLWLQNLRTHQPNHLHHMRQILRLSDLHGAPAVARVLRQSHNFGIYTWHTIENLLERHIRGQTPPPQPMASTAATRSLLEIRLPGPDLGHYPGNTSDT